MDQTSPNQQISQQIEQPQVPTNQEAPNTFTPKDKDNKKGLLFEIIFVVIFLVILFGILNYFNILKLSEIFPQLGFLPRREVPSGTSPQLNNVTIPPSEQAKQALTNFLPTVLNSSRLPTPSDVDIIQTKGAKESFVAFWNTKEGTSSAILVISPDGDNISQIYLSFLSPQTTSVSAELAQTVSPQYFSLQPKGEWRCSPLYGTTFYCENFWEEEKSGKKLGIGLTGTDPLSPTKMLTTFFCQYSKGSRLYAWKSCASEFSDTGVQ